MAVQHHPKDDETLVGKSVKGFMEAVKTPPSRTTWLLLVVALLAVILVGSWFYFTWTATAASSALWLRQYRVAPDVAELDRFAQDANQQTSVQARFALAEAASLRMDAAVVRLGSGLDRAKAQEDLVKARDAFDKLVRDAGDSPVLKQQCLMGDGKASEALGDLNKARQRYQQLAHDYPDTLLGKEAEARAKALDDENARKQMETLAAEFNPPAPAK